MRAGPSNGYWSTRTAWARWREKCETASPRNSGSPRRDYRPSSLALADVNDLAGLVRGLEELSVGDLGARDVEARAFEAVKGHATAAALAGGENVPVDGADPALQTL